MLSCYVKIYPCRDQSGSSLLYSTKKGSLIRVSSALLAAIEQDSLTDADRTTLTRLQILTDDPAAEREAMAQLVNRTNVRARTFFATVVLTLDCNLACPYCFEDHFRGRFAMNEATAGLLMEKIEQEEMGQGRDVTLRFYGGEPLLAVPRLKEIARRLHSAAAATAAFRVANRGSWRQSCSSGRRH